MIFLNLDREYEFFNWKKILEPIFEKKDFINGKCVSDFEEKVKEYIGAQYALGVSSGTDALWVSLLSLGIKNPTVLTTPYSFISTVEVPIRYGSKIVFCDIDKTFNIDIDKCKEIILNNHIDIFIPVHLFGLPCNLDNEILNICKKRGTYIIEDAAQSFGSKLKNKYVGTIGDIGCFSFFPSKNLGCAGDGGMVVTNSKEIYEKAKMIKNHGSCEKYNHITHGGNYRLDTIQAAILNAKLSDINYFIRSRIDTASAYNYAFKKIEEINIPKCKVGTHTYNQYVLQIKEDRDGLKEYLKKKDIPTALYYPYCLAEQPCYEGIDFGDNCPNSKKMTKQNLALPIAHLRKDEVDFIIKSINNFYGK